MLDAHQAVLTRIYDQPTVALSLKTRTVKAEAIEAFLYGCSTLNSAPYTTGSCIIVAQRKRPDHQMTSYDRALEITRCESIETTLRTRRL